MQKVQKLIVSNKLTKNSNMSGAHKILGSCKIDFELAVRCAKLRFGYQIRGVIVTKINESVLDSLE